ncbi:ABC transporter ATP-binding protein [Mobilicoccus pelagius]|uniref:Putative ABC transporter ATP-binding protein n=1 Tax=Mobilicoccus pelagius NBRC 104925 TaxID=1089455 RepID=H5UTS2_9MICO|nr:ABC transporter ATP-binding protein [Mobilicoccus pelagius]GAB49130.1 putative ABC transporter ATP-binding protein [Mobilicoccus pelagius NBRC 104925]
MTVPTGHAETPPVLQLRDVTRRFGDVEVLKPVTLDVQVGDYLAICGASGSGKSTMLNILGLLDRPSSGTVSVFGEPVDTLPDHRRAAIRGRTIGFVFQAFHLINAKSATENVELGMLYRGLPRVERRSRALAALDRVGLSHRRDASPATMSGGERQRTAIARALAARVDVLLADEPTGNLDSATGESILQLFDDVHADGLTLIVVTHSDEVAARAGRVAVMTDGHLAVAR